MTLLLCAATLALAPPKPLMRDFIGLNTHTIQFRTELYRPVTRHLRNYHPLHWDTGDDPSTPTTLPIAKNGVNWKELYGSWKTAGFQTLASVQFESVEPGQWTDIPKAAEAYGEAYARALGPTRGGGLVHTVEIGNEPEKFTPAQYRLMFESMAKGMRKGDPRLKIAPCAVAVGDQDRYSKDIRSLEGLESYLDVLNVHTYAFVEHWPTWRRSFPEDPSIPYLKQVQEVIDWRNRRAPGRPVWVTEFGYDASTKTPDASGDFAKWVGVTDLEQARYIVRSFLTFAAMDVDRAYLYWFNDEDRPMLHAASGLTRNYQPKPSYHAVAHLLKSLGDYRFSKVVAKGKVHAMEFASQKPSAGRVYVVWRADASNAQQPYRLRGISGQLVKAERMPTQAGTPTSVPVTQKGAEVELSVSGEPAYLWVK